MLVSDCATEDMAGLNDSDLKRIDARITAAITLLEEKFTAAIAPLSPRGWRRAANVLREFGTIANIIGVFVALLAIIAGLMYQSFSHVKEETQFRTNTGRDLADLKAQIGAMRLLVSASQPLRKENQQAAREALAESRSKSIHLPQDAVAQAGSNFVQSAEKNPGSWGVALEFAAYRSWLTPRVRQTDYTPIPIPWDSYMVRWWPGQPPPKPSAFGAAPINSPMAARMEKIGHAEPQPSMIGHQIFLLSGGTAVLDGMYMRHVVFEDVEVHYNGTPTVLDDVIFINCRFVFDNTKTARDLVAKILTSQPVSASLGA